MKVNMNGTLKDEEARTAGLMLFRVSASPTHKHPEQNQRINDYGKKVCVENERGREVVLR
jgi:hypothetical protein